MTTQTKKHTILIVDDEISLLNALRDKLTREGFSTLEAKKRRGWAFDLLSRASKFDIA